MDEAWRDMAERMVKSQIAARGVADPRVLWAIAQIPRHRFLPSPAPDGDTGQVAKAYADSALPIGGGQTISQPYMVAVMTELLGVQPGLKALEVGTGSGYQAAVLAKLGVQVVSVERSAELSARAAAVLGELGLADRVKLVVGDGSSGWPEDAPFHRILVTAGAPELPPAYREQLADGGRIVIPLGPRDEQELFVFTRHGQTWESQRMFGCRFVPLVGKSGWPV